MTNSLICGTRQIYRAYRYSIATNLYLPIYVSDKNKNGNKNQVLLTIKAAYSNSLFQFFLRQLQYYISTVLYICRVAQTQYRQAKREHCQQFDFEGCSDAQNSERSNIIGLESHLCYQNVMYVFVTNNPNITTTKSVVI